MRTTIFKQYKAPWASLPFPKGSTVAGCGCGLCSVTHVLIECDKYKDYTPAMVRPYMVKWAVRGQGLIHDGIPDTLRHYGMENVKEFGNSATMKQIWKELDKGARKGVILFGSTKGPDGTTWTGGGHFIAFLDYKVKNGKHYLYLKDSGGRDHDGWYCYEKSMAGDVRKVWTCTIPSFKAEKPKEPTTPYTGKLPSSIIKEKSKGADVKAVQSFLNWCIDAKLSVDGVAGAATVSAIIRYQGAYGLTADGVFGPQSLKKAKEIVDKHKPKTPAKTPEKPAEKPVEKKPSRAEIINETALKMAWPAGTPVSKYRKNTGSPNAAFRAAWAKRFPNTKPNTGCHSAVRLVLREAVDVKAMPDLNWDKILKYFRESGLYQEIKVNFTQEQLKPGDIRIHENDHGGHHIWIIVKSGGKWFRFEANQSGKDTDRYAHLNAKLGGNVKKHKKDYLFRVKEK